MPSDFQSLKKTTPMTSKVFKHRTDAILFEQLPTKEGGDIGRFYVTPDGIELPSMTTVLKIVSEQSIMEWRKRVGEEEANRVSTKASRRGTAVHYMCEDYINNSKEVFKGKNPVDVETFMSIKPAIDENIDNVYIQEAPLYSRFLQIAGRVDCIADWNDKLSIIDFKTSKKPKKKEWIESYFMQTAGYAIMFEELTGIPITQLVVLIAVDDNDPQVFIEHRDNYADKLIDVRSQFRNKYNV
jgi:hypothetical protein